MNRKHWILAASLLAASLATSLGPTQAAAQSDEERAAAQSLFNEAQQAKKDGDLEKACGKFEKSQRLDPAVGTQLNLADCLQQIGKSASAWVNYLEVAESKTAGERRSAFARKRADELEPKLTKLTIQVDAPVDGMTITRDRKKVASATWGTAVPVDPGDYEVVVEAPGKLPWSRTIEVDGQGEMVELRVPMLEDAPVEETPGDGTPGDEAEDGSTQMIVGGVVMGLGVAGVAAGIGLAVTAHGKYDESLDECDPNDSTMCSQAGVDLRGEAQSLQVGYMVSFGVGGAALIAGIIVMATAPSSPDEASEQDSLSLQLDPMVSPEGGYLQLTGRF
jgi:hypothetical protein